MTFTEGGGSHERTHHMGKYRRVMGRVMPMIMTPSHVSASSALRLPGV